MPPQPGRPASEKPASVAPPRYKIDAVIALAVLVVLLALWRWVNRPTVLGAAGSTIMTNVFGPFGVRLAQNLGGGGMEREADRQTTGAVNLARSTLPTNSTVPRALGSNAPTLADEVMDTNAAAKVFINDFSDTNSVDGPALVQRLDEVGAKGGDIQLSLIWNNLNDLDLHCIDPKGITIWYQNTNSIATGGMLDHDANASNYTDTPVENIYWPAGGAPAGSYQVFVVHFANRGSPDPTRYTVRVVVLGQTNYFTRAISHASQGQTNWICTIKYDPTNPDPSKRGQIVHPGQVRPNF